MRTVTSTREGGFSLLEIAVVLVIMGVVMALALPSYTVWIQNSQIRTAAGSILNGIQLARNEAVRRNARVQFGLTDVDSTAWTVCIPTPSTTVCPVTATIQSRSGADGSANVQAGVLLLSDAAVAFTTTLSSGNNLPASITFDSLGRPVDVNPISRIDVINPAITVANQRRLVITISTTGAIRMCDPQMTASAPTNPQAC